MEFIFSSLHTSFSNSGEDLLEEIEFDDWITLETTIAHINIWLFFTLVNLEEVGGQLVDLNKSVWDVLMTIRAMPSLFKSLVNFTLAKI